MVHCLRGKGLGMVKPGVVAEKYRNENSALFTGTATLLAVLAPREPLTVREIAQLLRISREDEVLQQIIADLQPVLIEINFGIDGYGGLDETRYSMSSDYAAELRKYMGGAVRCRLDAFIREFRDDLCCDLCRATSNGSKALAAHVFELSDEFAVNTDWNVEEMEGLYTFLQAAAITRMSWPVSFQRYKKTVLQFFSLWFSCDEKTRRITEGMKRELLLRFACRDGMNPQTAERICELIREQGTDIKIVSENHISRSAAKSIHFRFAVRPWGSFRLEADTVKDEMIIRRIEREHLEPLIKGAEKEIEVLCHGMNRKAGQS